MLYDWGDGNGKIHTISKAQHEANVKAKTTTGTAAPPLGYYDPNLDAQQRAETRAFENTTDDIGTATGRAGADLAIGTSRYGTEKTRAGQDYGTAVQGVERDAGRSLSDLILQRGRSGEDYQKTLGDLQRNYQTLANTQGEATRKAGAEATGGAYAQSARKRAANQALDQAPIDTAYQRFTADSQTAEGRLGEDKANSLASLLQGYNRANDDLDWNQGSAALGYERQTGDLSTQLQRASDEHTAFGQDIDTARQMQWGGPAVTSTIKPQPGPSSPTSSPAPTTQGQTLTAAPGLPGVKKKKGKGRVVTYTASVGGP
jgi:hypothetical protein